MQIILEKHNDLINNLPSIVFSNFTYTHIVNWLRCAVDVN